MHFLLRTSLLVLAVTLTTPALDLYVDPAGSDQQSGESGKPVASIARARDLVRASGKAGRERVTVHVQPGVYYLDSSLVFSAEDSGSADAPVLYRADDGGPVVISGGARLALTWEAAGNRMFSARLPVEKGTPPIDQLFVNGTRQIMARYPNFDPTVDIYNGFAADAFSRERAAAWADPTGGFIHAMHSAHWGGYHYRITGKGPDGNVTYEGGWQNNRQMGMHKQHRFVENIREELDTHDEWYHDARTGVLFYCPRPPLASIASLSTSVVEVVRLRQLVSFSGTRERPVRFVSMQGFTFRHAARTFMDTREPLLRSDWTIYRGGAVFFQGAEDCAVLDANFEQLGGNAVFVNNYNRRVNIRGCLFRDGGGNGVAFVGDPKAVRNPLFEYGQRNNFASIDRTPGPIGDNFPADCTVEDCLITRAGRVEKQAAGVQISMSQGITVRHCSIYEMPRAGINIGDGTWGGHLIEFCDVFDTVLETGDHGSFNAWARDRFWHLDGAPADQLATLALLDAEKPNVIRNSRWRCDHGWDIDLDDGSSNYEIYNNLLLRGGLKLREGFHRRVWNNVTVNNTLHPHVWYDDSRDRVSANIFMDAYKPAGGMPKGRWGLSVDTNFFATADANRTRFAEHGCDASSLSGDPQFVDPSEGDYRVKDSSAALKVGFVNFPMDKFGVQSPRLKAVARTPELPVLSAATSQDEGSKVRGDAVSFFWQGALVRELSGEEFSAYGVSRESGGVRLAELPEDAQASKAGLRAEDLIQSINGHPIRNIRELLEQTTGMSPLRVGYVRGQQSSAAEMTGYVALVREDSSSGSFKRLDIAGARSRVQIAALTARPAVNNEPIAALRDGVVARNYGPVFGNGVKDGKYRIDLGAVTNVSEIVTWSFNMGGRRGHQRFTVYGSAAETDPGWDVRKGGFRPIGSVDAAAHEDFMATSLRRSDGAPFGAFRWLMWSVSPVSDLGENTAFQEFQVRFALPTD